MQTIAFSLSLAAVLLATSSALADDTTAPAPIANPDKPVMTIAPPHFYLSVGAGASVSSVDAGSVHFISEHAHFDLGVGREVFATMLGAERLSVAIGYALGVDVNSDEVLSHHGFGVTLRKSWFYVSADVGVALLNSFDDGSIFVGGHFGAQAGFRVGPVQIGLPISLDFFSLSVMTFGATVGFQM